MPPIVQQRRPRCARNQSCKAATCRCLITSRNKPKSRLYGKDEYTIIHNACGLRYDTIWLSQNPFPKPIAPYEVESVAAERSLRSLIHHYNTVMVGQSMCPGPKRQFYPIAIQHETLFHTVMYCAAAHLAVLRCQDRPLEALYHHNQALRLFTRQIDEGAEGINLARLISATCMMFTLETLEGSETVSRIHWDGLSNLVEAAGGLEALSKYDNTRRYVLWADLAASAALASRPRFISEISETSSALRTYFGPDFPLTDTFANALRSKLYAFTGAADLSQRVATAYLGMRCLSQMDGVRQTEAFADTADINSIQFSDRIDVLEYLVGPLWCPNISDVEVDGSHPIIFKIFGFGTLIYIYTSLREMPFRMRVMATHASRLLQQIEAAGEVEVNFMCRTFPDMMLWLFFLGGKAAAPQERPVFARLAAQILAVGGVEGVTNVQDAMTAFLWPKEQDGVLN